MFTFSRSALPPQIQVRRKDAVVREVGPGEEHRVARRDIHEPRRTGTCSTNPKKYATVHMQQRQTS